MQSKKTLLAVLFGITLLAGFLRAYRLSSLVTTLNRDEAALAYNAKLLKETGKDEWGVRWPLYPRSFGDSKLIGYPLLLVGLFQFLPYQDWVVRLPAVIAGSVLPLVGYGLARGFHLRRRHTVVVAFLLATTPVLIHFSRFGYEAVVALLEITAGLALLIRTQSSLRRRWLFDALAAALFLLSLFTYNTPLLLVPFFAFVPPLLRKFRAFKSWLPGSGMIVLVWCIAAAMLFPMLSQKSGISIFTDETYIQQYPVFRAQFSSPLQTLVGNKFVFYGTVIASNIVESFSPQFLVTRGGAHPWHSLADFGHITVLQYCFALLGIGGLLFSVLHRQRRSRAFSRRHAIVLLGLLLIALVPASITVDAPHATRSLLFFVLLSLLATVPLVLFDWLKRKNRWSIALITFVVLSQAILTGNYFLHYLQNYPAQANRVYQAGFSSVINQADSRVPNAPAAVVDEGGYQYILLAWYGHFSPSDFFASIHKQQPNQIGLQYGDYLGRYHFIGQASDRSETERTLIYWDDQTNEWQLETL